MASYRLARQDFYFSYPFPELERFESKVETSEEVAALVSDPFTENSSSVLISRMEGWVGGAQRLLEVYDKSDGMLLRVEGCGEFFVTRYGESVGKLNSQKELSQLDREIILGPALVLALALRGVWSLHASAVTYKENLIAFLGESGQGKSTLAAYLSQRSGWHLVADDILPIQIIANDLNVLPHFPQLKLPGNVQPAIGLPEQLPLKYICVLTHAEPDQMPELHSISTAQTIQVLISHIAGTRMFDASLLVKHLDFSAQVAKQVPAYRLINPHRSDTLPLVMEFLEKIC